ncbi:MAG TPA: FAD-binding oxidoreductase [Bauldia sp.]|nr:FAD-binding oxidoreductase [Bauldia sp.]
MGESPLFAPDFSPTCYWHDRTPLPDMAPRALPTAADVVVIGAGYTGLCAALELARAGRETVVVDAEAAGWGCSTRNGGQVSAGIKPGYDALKMRLGESRAVEILKEGRRSLAWLGEFISREAIDCDFRVSGRFHAAHSPAAYAKLAATLDRRPDDLEADAVMVPRDRQREELGTDAYFGGVVQTRNAGLDPARYHRGLMDRALAAGVVIVSHCRSNAIAREGRRLVVATTRGTVTTGKVVVATNGYTGPLIPWLRRRIIPIGSYIIATEPIGPELMARLFPTDRVVTDTRKVVYYYRPSPDRTRVLFGGRVSAAETDPRKSAAPLRAEMGRLFPEVASVRVSRSWMGFVAYTFDTLPHLGARDGIHYAMGYCGSGVAMAGYLGTRLAQQLLGKEEGRTAFDDVPFPTRPYYFGKPWFLSPAIAWYRWRDRGSTRGQKIG